jgi:hypothetical protein
MLTSAVNCMGAVAPKLFKLSTNNEINNMNALGVRDL